MLNYVLTENTLTIPKTEEEDKITLLLSEKNTFSGEALTELFKKKNVCTLILPDTKPESISFAVGCMIGQLNEGDRVVICDNKISLPKNIFDLYPISYLEEKKKVVRKRKKKEESVEKVEKVEKEKKRKTQELKEEPKEELKTKDLEIENKDKDEITIDTQDSQDHKGLLIEYKINSEEYRNIPITELDIYKKRGCEATKKKIDEILEDSENLSKRELERKINTSFIPVHDVKILKKCLL